jgi:hypothetical protein
VQQQLFAGIDWATNTHAVCVVDQGGGVRARFEVVNGGKTFAGLVKRLGKLAVAGVAIERPDGPLVQAMLDAGLRVVVITPRQVKALRSRYGAAGAKSDPGDAYVLADALRTDGHRLAPRVPCARFAPLSFSLVDGTISHAPSPCGGFSWSPVPDCRRHGGVRRRRSESRIAINARAGRQYCLRPPRREAQ